jgi:mono/diheme cytochrome c family protein
MNYIKLIVVALFVSLMAGCAYQDGERNIEYSPNMYHSVPLEPYSQVVDDWAQSASPQTIFENGLNAQAAPDGTVPRTDTWYYKESYEPFHLEESLENYERSATEVFSPLDSTGHAFNDIKVDCSEESFQRGKVHYETYCIMCHGPNGQGKGSLAVKGNKPFEGVVPSYTSAEGTGLKNLSEGKMFYSITYGKGVMGSYASQLTPKERWEVICYIQHYQRKD